MEHYYHTKTQLPYELLLQDERWLRRREQILQRDRETCQKCGCQYFEQNLNVHHYYYIANIDPWEYDDKALITFCHNCHTRWHEENDTPLYYLENGKTYKYLLKICERCGGVGFFPEYRHVQDGVCFRCRGQRFEEMMLKEETHDMDEVRLACTNYLSDEDIYHPLTDKVMSDLLGYKTKIIEAQVNCYSYRKKNLVILILHDGRRIETFLDLIKMDELTEDTMSKNYNLNINALRYKIRTRPDGSGYLVVSWYD